MRADFNHLVMLFPAAWVGLLPTGCDVGARRAAVTTQRAAMAGLQEAHRRADALYRQGLRARAAGELERARVLLKQAVEADGSHGYARHALGLVYAELGDLYHAAVHLDAAGRLLTDLPQPCYNLGCVLERGGQYELAIASYERALRRRPDHLPTLENLARVRIKAGYRDEATLRLLRRCRERESRQEWVQWLDRQLARLSALHDEPLQILETPADLYSEGNIVETRHQGTKQ